MKEFDPAKYYGGSVTAPKTPEKAPEQPPNERIGKTGTVTTRNHGKARKDSRSRLGALGEIKAMLK